MQGPSLRQPVTRKAEVAENQFMQSQNEIENVKINTEYNISHFPDVHGDRLGTNKVHINT